MKVKAYDMPPLKKRLYVTTSGEPPREDSVPSSSLSLTSLPEEIIFNCLIRVPRCYYQNLCRVSKTLRSLVRSPEFLRLRSLLPKPKDSVYISTSYGWLTLRATEKTATKIKYQLVSNPIPFPTSHLVNKGSTIAVGSEIFFIGGSVEQPSSELWILDTRSGELTQGPSMNVARTSEAVVEKVHGKVYVIGGCNDNIQVELFDPKSREWKVVESLKHKLQLIRCKRLSASVNGKVYMEEGGRIAAYDPRKGGRLEEVKSPSNGGDLILRMVVVDDLLYVHYKQKGLMGFDAKRKVWRRVVGMETLDVNFYNAAMVEYDGMLLIFWNRWINRGEIRCALIALDWIGDVVRGTIHWSGTVATTPYYFDKYLFFGRNFFDKYLVCSN